MNSILTKIKGVSLLLVSLMAVSCHFLEEDPKNQLDESRLISDARSLYLVTLGDLYARFGSSVEGEGLMGTGRGIYDLNTFTTDEAMIPIRGADWNDGGLWKRLFMHTWEAGEAPIKNAWTYLFRMVVLSNQALGRLERYRQLLTSEQYDDVQAEIRCVRAYMYLHLMDLFGRVPLITSESQSFADVKQSERSTVFAFVRDELEAALPSLPVARSNDTGIWYGRITRPVAFTLLARLYLNADVYMDDDWTDGVRPTHPEAYQKVLEYCDSVSLARIANPYDLAYYYHDNFSVNNESSVENILTIPMNPFEYAAQFHYIFRSLHYDHAAALGMSGENGPCATPEALTAYAFGTASEDPRFAENFWGGDAVDAEGKPVSTAGGTLKYKPRSVLLDLSDSPDQKVAGARMKKYAHDPNCRADGKLVNNDLVLLRYADILLMSAEAMMRLGNDGTAPLNLVRVRVNAPTLTVATLDDVLRERLLEFCWEGHRRTDLIRFGKYTDARSFRPQLAGEETGYTTVFPIPADVIAVTKLEQNKGYN